MSAVVIYIGFLGTFTALALGMFFAFRAIKLI